MQTAAQAKARHCHQKEHTIELFKRDGDAYGAFKRYKHRSIHDVQRRRDELRQHGPSCSWRANPRTCAKASRIVQTFAASLNELLFFSEYSLTSFWERYLAFPPHIPAVFTTKCGDGLSSLVQHGCAGRFRRRDLLLECECNTTPHTKKSLIQEKELFPRRCFSSFDFFFSRNIRSNLPFFSGLVKFKVQWPVQSSTKFHRTRSKFKSKFNLARARRGTMKTAPPKF